MKAPKEPILRHSPPVMVGELHEQYKLLELVGQGSMGSVFRARDSKLQREVAVKFLELAKFDATAEVREELRRRFMREARLLARLSHPHLVQVYAAVFDVTQPFFVMEYLPGPTLDHRIELRPCLGYAEICDIAMQIVEALWFAWQTEHVIHCDLKPSNILFADRETVKITDMGIAQVIGRQGAPGTDDRLAFGTLAYMAPEQQTGERELDHRVDLYALGVMLVELFSFHLPFDGDDAAVVLAAKQRGPAFRLERYARGLPTALVDLTYGLLEPDPARRRSSHGDILDLLDQALADLRQRQPEVRLHHGGGGGVHHTIRLDQSPGVSSPPLKAPAPAPLPPVPPLPHPDAAAKRAAGRLAPKRSTRGLPDL